MSWPFETSEPFVTPEHSVEFQRRRLELTPEEWALPPTLVATFQREAHARLLERAGLAPEDADQGGARPPGPAVGAVDGVPVAVTRDGIGAPAAAFV